MMLHTWLLDPQKRCRADHLRCWMFCLDMGKKAWPRGIVFSAWQTRESKVVAELLPGTGIMHHSWKAGLEISMHFVDCLVPICNSKRNFETMDGFSFSPNPCPSNPVATFNECPRQLHLKKNGIEDCCHLQGVTKCLFFKLPSNSCLLAHVNSQL